MKNFVFKMSGGGNNDNDQEDQAVQGLGVCVCCVFLDSCGSQIDLQKQHIIHSTLKFESGGPVSGEICF